MPWKQQSVHNIPSVDTRDPFLEGRMPFKKLHLKAVFGTLFNDTFAINFIGTLFVNANLDEF